MKIIAILFMFCSILCYAFHINAEEVYTWTDEVGTIHISPKTPPKNVPKKEKLVYYSHFRPSPEVENNHPVAFDDSPLFEAVRKAKEERKKAAQARRIAVDAIEKANQMKKETDEFLQPWRNKTRIRSSMLLKIENRIQATNQVIEVAQKHIRAANEAEINAQRAEAEAVEIEKQFFDQYQSIKNK